jgi:hypothetical protein
MGAVTEQARRLTRLRTAHVRRGLARTAGKGILVLGMHRSGTSVVTQTLSLLGPAPCVLDDRVRGPWNPQGHYESRTLMHLDNCLLVEMGHRWWYPPETGERYEQAARRIRTSKSSARRQFLAVHPVSPWVWKDPRACVLLPFWRGALGSRTAAVLVFRHPLDVAQSLERRHGTGTRYGLALWERYNRLLLAHSAGMDVLAVSYESIVEDPGEWVRRAKDFVSDVGMSGSEARTLEAVEAAVTPELSHGGRWSEGLSSVPAGALGVYEAIDRTLGRHRNFEPPSFARESPEVQEELEEVRSRGRPRWRPPSGTEDERGAETEDEIEAEGERGQKGRQQSS